MVESKTSTGINPEIQALTDHLQIRSIQRRLGRYCLWASAILFVCAVIAILLVDLMMIFICTSLAAHFYWSWVLMDWDARQGFRYDVGQRAEETPIETIGDIPESSK